MENPITVKNLQEVLDSGSISFPDHQWIVGCDPYKVEEPLNFWHKIKYKLGLKYKTKDVGWEYTVFKQQVIDGKITVEYKGRE